MTSADNKAADVIKDSTNAIVTSTASRQFSRHWSGPKNPKGQPGQKPIAKPPVIIDSEPTTILDDPWLVDLTAQVRSEHEAVIGSFKSGFEHAVRCGELLLEAKEVAGHGNWAKWLSGMPFAETTARGYMRMAEAWPSMPDENRQRVADLSWREALKAIAKPRDTEPASATAPSTPTSSTPSEKRVEAIVTAMHDAEPSEREKASHRFALSQAPAGGTAEEVDDDGTEHQADPTPSASAFNPSVQAMKDAQRAAVGRTAEELIAYLAAFDASMAKLIEARR